MARSKTFFDDVKNHLECSVCQEQFSEINEPKILKCLHTFCKTCLEAWLRQQREGELSCPTCREITECPNNNINSLPSNLFCKQLVEIVEAYSGQGQEDSPHCGICDEKKSLKFYCSDCNSFLCDDCVRAHFLKGKVFKGHHVKEIGNFESSDVEDYARRANFCKKHKDEMRFFCEKCQICICRDCAILEHQDHNKISLDQGLENNKSEIENKMRKVEENGSRLRGYKGSLEKRRLQVNGRIEEATKEVKRVAERCILLIRQHEANVTERLVDQKAAFQDAFDTQMTSLDGKLMEIVNTLAFSEDVLLRKNLPEILNVKATIEQRLQELSVPLKDVPKLGLYSGVKYVQSDVSFLPDALGKLVTTDTEPSLSVAEGKGLTEGLVGEDCSFSVITKNSRGQTTYSEIDEVNVKITSLSKDNIKTVVTDLNDGRYSISYRPTTPGEFTVSIEVEGNEVMGSPFKLKVSTRSQYSKQEKTTPLKSTRSRITCNNSDASMARAFGSLPTPNVMGITMPPKSLADNRCGTMRGLQGHRNSCYLDATLYSMFAFSSVFDTLLHRQRKEGDLPEYEDVQFVLRESIVNPLRVYGFVRADRILQLRELLDKLSSTAGLVHEEKDPEEFLNSLLQQVLKAHPFIHLKSRDSEGAFFYQIITEKDEDVKLPRVQQLLDQSFLSEDIILSKVPSCLILRMPRFGSRYKMYDMILPNLELDVTNHVENVPRECTMCGSEVAQFECKMCYLTGLFGDGAGIISYCHGCNAKIHSRRDRVDHKPRPFLLPRQWNSERISLDKQMMDLFAVVCIDTSHYVAFVKCGVSVDAPWCFFDSMADRAGEKGYNIPAVTRCPEALEWLSKEPKEIIAAKERGDIPEKIRRLLGDGYLCMYQNLI